jgi:hypothetical protein
VMPRNQDRIGRLLRGNGKVRLIAQGEPARSTPDPFELRAVRRSAAVPGVLVSSSAAVSGQ